MDHGPNQTLAADATTNSSVSSVASSLANLDLNPSTINRLPDKLLQRILSKVERMVPIQKFAHLRTVDTRWRSVVDDICKEKKSLILMIDTEYRELPKVEDMFFGLLNETDSMRVNIQSLLLYDDGDFYIEVNVNLFDSLLKAFPNIEQLSVCCPNADGIEFYVISYINSLGSLKQLYLYGLFQCVLKITQHNYIVKKLSQFEFFLCIFHTTRLHENDVRSGGNKFDYIRKLHARNPRWLANVNRFNFPIGLNDQFDQIVNFLGQATRLNVLHIKFCDATQMTAAVFGYLGKLTQLKEIALGPVNFDVLKQTAVAVEENNFSPLGTIITCNLVISDFRFVTVDQFAGILLAIFPNVAEWKFAFIPKVLGSFRTKLEQNSNFENRNYSNIRSCKIIENTNLDEFFELLNNSAYF